MKVVSFQSWKSNDFQQDLLDAHVKDWTWPLVDLKALSSPLKISEKVWILSNLFKVHCLPIGSYLRKWPSWQRLWTFLWHTEHGGQIPDWWQLFRQVSNFFLCFFSTDIACLRISRQVLHGSSRSDLHHGLRYQRLIGGLAHKVFDPFCYTSISETICITIVGNIVRGDRHSLV